MSRTRRSTLVMASLASWLGATTVAPAQDAPRPQPKAEQPAPAERPKGDQPGLPGLEFKDEIKPLPPAAFPDDPPPHEGALIDIPLTLEPPDMIVVEVLEALPGRPITGERLVRPDGTVSLGFYGDVYVRGLTPRQAKEKIVIHLREHLNDYALGLLTEVGVPGGLVIPEAEGVPMPGNEGRSPFQLDPTPPGDKKPDPVPDAAPPTGKKPEPEAKPGEVKDGPIAQGAALRRYYRQLRRRRVRRTALQEARRDEPKGEKPQDPAATPGKPQENVVVEVEVGPAQYRIVEPADSRNVFVDIVAHNTKVYYVQGDVGVPGRLPVTGKETVLDALNYAGGLVPSAEPADIHLYRPARGGKPAKDYKIDYQAILRGEATGNLQMFPNDRLVVGRNPIVKKTIELDRAGAAINSLFHSMFPDRSDPALAPARREALVKEWAEFLWSVSNKDGGAMLDEEAFKAALMKKLVPPQAEVK